MTGKEDMKSMSVRRAKLVDAGKVSYRVYRNPSDFVTVVAETALMAVRLSEVKEPYKIVRDIATDATAIEAQKMAPPEANPEKIHFTLEEQSLYQTRVAEMPETSAEPSQPFVPVPLLDLQYKGGKRARILPPEMLNEIIEAHAKGAQKPVEEPAPEPVPPAAPRVEEAPIPVYTPPPEPEAVAPPAPTPAPDVPPEPLSPEALSALAQQVLPETLETAREEEPAPALSPEEVAKLLNG